MQIKFEGSLTMEEFKNAAKLMNHPLSKRKGLGADLWWIILAFIGAGLIAMSIRALFVEQNINAGILWGAVGAVAFSYGLKLRTAIDRAWDESAKNKPKFEGVAMDEYLEMRGPEGMLQIFWTAFSGYGEIDDIIILIRDNMGHPFPARFFQNEADWQEFRKFIASKLAITHKMEKNAVSISTILLIGWIILSILLVILVVRPGAK